MDQATTLRRVSLQNSGQLSFDGLHASTITLLFTQGALDLAPDLASRFTQMIQKYLNPTLFVADQRELPRGIQSFRKFSIQQMLKEFIDVNDLNGWGVQSVVFYAGVQLEEEKSSFFINGRKVLLFLGPKEKDTLEAIQRLRSIEKKFGVKKIDVISLGYESEKLSRAQFIELNESVNRFTPLQLNWRGSLKFHEKISDSIARWKFLVNLKSGYGSESELHELLIQLGLLPAQNAQTKLPRIEAR